MKEQLKQKIKEYQNDIISYDTIIGDWTKKIREVRSGASYFMSVEELSAKRRIVYCEKMLLVQVVEDLKELIVE